MTRHRMKNRRGFTLTEWIVACALLVALLGVVAPLTVRSGQLWRDSRHRQLGLDELSNHLERLTSLAPEQRVEAIKNLTPSEHMTRALPSSVLKAEIISDADGKRLVMTLNWDRPGDPGGQRSKPLTLVGWLDPISNGLTTQEDAT